MEYNENDTETNPEDQNEITDFQESSAKQWFRDNLRIIVSVLIVVVIAGGIYSYSKRTEAPKVADNNASSSVIDDLSGNQNDQSTTQDNSTTSKPADTKASKPADTTSSVSTSQETDKSFVETAARGDSATKLARKALANYLEKNTDSSLKPEQKIYIEDYLRKKVATKKVSVGTSVEFEKSLISDAISRSKNLSDTQIKNLHKFAVRVPSLS